MSLKIHGVGVDTPGGLSVAVLPSHGQVQLEGVAVDDVHVAGL